MNRKILSLEEDFKALGLPVPGQTTSKPVVESKEEPKVEAPKAEAPKTETPVVEGEQQVDEVKQVRVKRHTAADRRKWKMAKRKGTAKAKSRKYRNKASVKRMLKKHRAKADKMRHGKAAGRKRMMFQGLDQVSNILENVQKVLAEIEKPSDTYIKAFESVMGLTNKMSDSLAKVSVVEGLEAEDAKYLADTAAEYAEISESAAEIVKALKAGEAVSAEELEENFSLYLRALQEGLDLVADVLEDDALTEAVKAMVDEACDDEEDEDDEEDDEEDEEEDEGNS